MIHLHAHPAVWLLSDFHHTQVLALVVPTSRLSWRGCILGFRTGLAGAGLAGASLAGAGLAGAGLAGAGLAGAGLAGAASTGLRASKDDIVIVGHQVP